METFLQQQQQWFDFKLSLAPEGQCLCCASAWCKVSVLGDILLPCTVALKKRDLFFFSKDKEIKKVVVEA